MGGWWNKLWYIHAVEHCSAINIISAISSNLDESPENYMERKSQSPKVTYCIIPSTEHFKMLSSRNGEQIRGLLRRRVNKEKVGCASTRVTYGPLWWWKCAVSWLYQCRNPRCGFVLWFCKTLPLGKTGENHTGSLCIVSYNYTWNYNYLQSSQNLQLSWSKKFNINKVYSLA